MRAMMWRGVMIEGGEVFSQGDSGDSERRGKRGMVFLRRSSLSCRAFIAFLGSHVKVLERFPRKGIEGCGRLWKVIEGYGTL
jgi:hypothetical protein